MEASFLKVQILKLYKLVKLSNFFPNSVSLEGSSGGKKGPESATGESGAASRRRAPAEPALSQR